MSFRSRNKLALVFASSVYVAFASGQAFAQQASAAPTEQGQPAPGLSAEKVAEYTNNPGQMLSDFAGKPELLSAAITQLSVLGTQGANASTSFLKIAADAGNKELAEAAAKGLGIAVGRLSKAGNVALASSLQATVASITSTFPVEIASAVNAAFVAGQGGVATAAIGAGGAGDNATGSAGSGGNGSNSPTIGASNGFSAGAFGGTSIANSGGTSFGGAGGPSSGAGDTTNSFSFTISTSVSASPT